MRIARWRAVPLVLLLGVALVSCDGPNRGTNTNPSAAGGFNIVVTASPNTLHAMTVQTTANPAQAGDCTVIQAKVYDTKGQLVDGAPVTFTVGNLTPPATGPVVTTVKGVATTTACAGTRTGTTIVTAAVEDAFATTQITVF